MIYVTSNKKVLKKRLHLIDSIPVLTAVSRWIFFLPDSECKMYCTIREQEIAPKNILESFVITHNDNILTSFTSPECRPSDSESKIIMYLLT